MISRRALLCAAAVGAACGPVQAFFNYRFRWVEFCEANLDGTGRVIDASDERRITTSEGESYALFFSLVEGDRQAFARILSWTENNLCAGDIAQKLPAWLWGRLPEQKRDAMERWGVLDGNNATDADMWIAYCLLEAGRLWNSPEYTRKGRAVLALIKAQVRHVERLGDVLLPAAHGFERDRGVKIFNPSYLPTMVLRRFSEEDPYWGPVAAASNRLILRTAANGFSPDWAAFDADGLHVVGDKDVGGYDAIRVYLWLGMLNRRDPARALLERQFLPMVRLTQVLGHVPERVNMATLEASGEGPLGFSACMIQLLTDRRAADLVRKKMRTFSMKSDTYYQNCLIMFAQGFDDGAFSFDEKGALRLGR